jgi:hypothetical protein
LKTPGHAELHGHRLCGWAAVTNTSKQEGFSPSKQTPKPPNQFHAKPSSIAIAKYPMQHSFKSLPIKCRPSNSEISSVNVNLMPSHHPAKIKGKTKNKNIPRITAKRKRIAPRKYEFRINIQRQVGDFPPHIPLFLFLIAFYRCFFCFNKSTLY